MQWVENNEQWATKKKQTTCNKKEWRWNANPVVYVVSDICPLIILCDYQRVTNTSEKKKNESGSSYELRYIKDSIDIKTWFWFQKKDLDIT